MDEANAITVNDTFVTPVLMEQIQQFFERSVRWSYGWESAANDAPFCHWNHDFLKTSRRNAEDSQMLLFLQDDHAILQEIWMKLRDGPLRGHVLLRCYANAHTYGTEGYPHLDARQPDFFTTIFYVNPVWKPDWAGETVFFNADRDIAKAVLPKPGRLVIFPGNILHVARGLSRACPAMRVTLMFKTRLDPASRNDTDQKENHHVG